MSNAIVSQEAVRVSSREETEESASFLRATKRQDKSHYCGAEARRQQIVVEGAYIARTEKYRTSTGSRKKWGR